MTTPRDYLSRLNSSVIRLGLGPVSRLLKACRDPQGAFASVIIGGTNGKGSIAAALESILRQAGYRTGLYTSPHLIDLRERIRVDGGMIAWEDLDALIEEVRSRMKEEVTYFEFLTAAAFLYFRRMKVDVAVLEVGLGGRLDATNVVDPLVSVISNVSVEHSEYLGKRLTDIAREKGGIVKEGGLCVTAVRQAQVLKTLQDICRQRRARLFRLGKDLRVRRHRDGTFTYYGINHNFERLPCVLPGRHQLDNAALALGAVELMAERGFPVGRDAVYEGLRRMRWEGRLEVLRRSPALVVDGGHNPAGIAVLCRALRRDFSYRRLILIFAVMGDKNYGLMLKRLAPLSSFIILTRPRTERAVPSAKMAPLEALQGKDVEIIEDTEAALLRALSLAEKDDLVCAAGSLFLVGEIKEAWARMANKQEGR